jgi:hypothetical protein
MRYTDFMKTEIKRQKRETWPVWQNPADKELRALARILLPYIRILSPEIITIIVNDNNRNLRRWTSAFTRLGIRPDIYLWKDSPVTFPGVRRYSGQKEIALFKRDRKTARGENALVLDDNSFPKHLWSFALRNYEFSTPGPTNYSLAHLLDHKDYKSKNVEELVGYEKSDEKHLFAGLYTSCTNTIWVPNQLLKPTDHNGKLRLLLRQIIHKYYSSVCTALPPKYSLNLDKIDKPWHLDNFPEPTLVGNLENARNFLEYRNEKIDQLIKNQG